MMIVALVAGALAGFLFAQVKVKDVHAHLLLAQQQAEAERQAKDEVQRQLQESALSLQELQTKLSDTKAQLSGVQAQLDTERERNASETKLRQEQTDREMQLRQQQFQEQLRTVQEQFSTLATKVLDQTADKLKATNNEEMQHITQPLRDNIDKLHEAIAKTNQETAKSTASLSQQLNAMAEQTQKIDTTATRLTNVMRGSNKLQGNWGELFLQDIQKLRRDSVLHLQAADLSPLSFLQLLFDLHQKVGSLVFINPQLRVPHNTVGIGTYHLIPQEKLLHVSLNDLLQKNQCFLSSLFRKLDKAGKDGRHLDSCEHPFSPVCLSHLLDQRADIQGFIPDQRERP